jgi:hypothetical protein
MSEQITSNTQACIADSIQQDKNRVLNYLRRERERRMESIGKTAIQTPARNGNRMRHISPGSNEPISPSGKAQEGPVEPPPAVPSRGQPAVERRVSNSSYFKDLDKWLDVTGYHDLEYRSLALKEHHRTGRQLRCKIDVHHNAPISTAVQKPTVIPKPTASVTSQKEPTTFVRNHNASSRYGADTALQNSWIGSRTNVGPISSNSQAIKSETSYHRELLYPPPTQEHGYRREQQLNQQFRSRSPLGMRVGRAPDQAMLRNRSSSPPKHRFAAMHIGSPAAACRPRSSLIPEARRQPQAKGEIQTHPGIRKRC